MVPTTVLDRPDNVARLVRHRVCPRPSPAVLARRQRSTYVPGMLRLRPIDVYAAAQRLRGVVTRTPLIRSRALGDLVGADVWLKLECEQVTGSFKIRGAYNVLASLPEELRARGVVAASAGNHGMGVAKAARELGIPATIFVPRSAPGVKREGIAGFGATIDVEAGHFDEAHLRAAAMARRTGATFVHPCEGEVLIAGQGTVGLEILEDLPEVATIVVPVGGAGLVAGIASLVRAVAPQVRILGVQTSHTDAIARALASGQPTASEHLPTIAEGLSGDADAYALELARFALDDMIVVSEESTAGAIAWLARGEGLTVEGSGAVGAAAARDGALSQVPGPVVIVVTGRNIDPDLHQELVRKSAGLEARESGRDRGVLPGS